MQTLPTDEAIQALLAGDADIVASGRAPRPAELEQARMQKIDLASDASRHLVGVNVIGVAVHQGNPVEALTYDQVVGVFCTREITDWGALGGTPGPIAVTVPDLENVSTRALFENFFCGVHGLDPKLAVGEPEAVREALTNDPAAISFVSASEGVGQLLALSVEPEAPPVKPTQDNIIRGSYPLYDDVYLLTRGEPSAEIGAFLDWIASPAGQEVVDEHRLVPLFLRPERLDEPRPLRETIRFEAGSPAPDDRSQARMGVLVDEITERKLRHVILEGFTDDREPNPLALAQKRAEAVREALAQEMGPELAKQLYFEIIPRGAERPIAPNDTPYGRQINRRVQVYLAEDEAGGGDEAVVVDSETPAAPSAATDGD
ncbi:MAG: phosphate ABC transporter substrate-binding/OmpA family protein [Myxococcota bacterium]